jgi:hypothetical protein
MIHRSIRSGSSDPFEFDPDPKLILLKMSPLSSADPHAMSHPQLHLILSSVILSF